MKPIRTIVPPNPLRTPSARPELLLDQRAFRVVDPPTGLPPPPTPQRQLQGTVGRPAQLGLSRVVPTLRLQDGPVLVQPPAVVHDNDLVYLADPDGNLIGVAGIRVHRLVSATKVENTRRL